MAITIHKYGNGRYPKVGDRVLIVDKRSRGHWNQDGYMDKYLSKVMTVRITDHIWPNFTLRMEEDIDEHDGGWYWYPEMIAGYLSEEGIEEDTSGWADSSCVGDLFM